MFHGHYMLMDTRTLRTGKMSSLYWIGAQDIILLKPLFDKPFCDKPFCDILHFLVPCPVLQMKLTKDPFHKEFISL